MEDKLENREENVQIHGEQFNIAKISASGKIYWCDSAVNIYRQRKSFHTNHEEELVGVDCTKNEEFIICSDTVKTVLWNMEKSKSPYLVADLQKSMKIEEVKENINCVKAHPESDSLFAFGTNRGSINLCDMRAPSKLKDKRRFVLSSHF